MLLYFDKDHENRHFKSEALLELHCQYHIMLTDNARETFNHIHTYIHTCFICCRRSIIMSAKC